MRRRLIEHRAAAAPRAAPLRAIDQVEARAQDGTLLVTASKDVVVTDPYLDAHFPGRPIYPGVFILESARQAVIEALEEVWDVRAELSAVHSLRLLRPVLPGQRVSVLATVTRTGPGGELRAVVRCGGEGGPDVARLTLGFRAGD